MRIKIRIDLLGITKPKVWREMWIPMNITFHKFHLLIQEAMGWKNYHWYEFAETRDSHFFIIKSPYAEDMPGVNAKKVLVDGFLLAYYNSVTLAKAMARIPHDRIYYTYDYGDHWEHCIEILDMEPSDYRRAELIGGSGACPPEDCGSIYGYQDLIKALASGKAKAKNMLHWLEECGYNGFDPDEFDLEMARLRVGKVR
jgi:hypothetical protein